MKKKELRQLIADYKYLEKKFVGPKMQEIDAAIQEIWPELSEEEAQDWTCDLVTSQNRKNVSEIFQRIEDYQKS